MPSLVNLYYYYTLTWRSCQPLKITFHACTLILLHSRLGEPHLKPQHSRDGLFEACVRVNVPGGVVCHSNVEYTSSGCSLRDLFIAVWCAVVYLYAFHKDSPGTFIVPYAVASQFNSEWILYILHSSALYSLAYNYYYTVTNLTCQPLLDQKSKKDWLTPLDTLSTKRRT